ncbi:hypothetical protein [Humidesulfovibrio idahonensis]
MRIEFSTRGPNGDSVIELEIESFKRVYYLDSDDEDNGVLCPWDELTEAQAKEIPRLNEELWNAAMKLARACRDVRSYHELGYEW